MDEEQMQLFGAPMGRVLTATINVDTVSLPNGRWKVTLTVTAEMRNRPMILWVYPHNDRPIIEYTGPMNAIVGKCYWAQSETIRALMVRLFVKWGKDLEDVEIFGCGNGKKGIA